MINSSPEMSTELSSQMMQVVGEHAEDVEGKLTDKELQNLSEVLKTVTKDSAVDDIRTFLQDLKEDRQDFKEDVEDLQQFTQKSPVRASDRLGSRVDKMIQSIEEELQKYDSDVGSKLNLMKTNEEGQLSIGDLEEALKVIRNRPNDDRIKKIVNQLDADHDGLIAINELLQVKVQEGHGEVLKPDSKDKK